MMNKIASLVGFALVGWLAAGALAQPRPPGANVDAPQISRSVGVEGGVVLFWPRIIPADDSGRIQPLADALQARLRGLVERALPGRTIDVRPEPERVCPQAGCEAMTVGVLLTHHDRGCAAIALISDAGRAPARLVPWAGAVRLSQTVVPFREPPEGVVTIADYAPCDDLLEWLSDGDQAVVEAIREAEESARD